VGRHFRGGVKKPKLEKIQPRDQEQICFSPKGMKYEMSCRSKGKTSQQSKPYDLMNADLSAAQLGGDRHNWTGHGRRNTTATFATTTGALTSDQPKFI
jgi:hypothetical protein